MIRLFLWLCALSVVACRPALAITLAELQADGHLSINTSVQPDTNIVPGQRVQLIIEIGVDTWFTGGTRISVPEVPGLVILQTEQFASNASEQRDGDSWVLQRWTLDVYPQREGTFEIPPVKLRLKIHGGNAGDIEGDLYSPGANFSAVTPAALTSYSSWVASPEFSISQSFDQGLEELRVGDAFERVIEWRASEVQAMMLPALRFEGLPGLTAYPEPPVLDNSNNRGEVVASRTLRISYVAEQPGEYELPGLEFPWWNTTRDALELLALPATSVKVGGIAGRAESRADATGLRWWWAGALLALAALWMLRHATPHLQKAAHILTSFASKLQVLRRPALPDRLNP
ncbi:MAG: BatD family protein [Pseudomonadota bacterium]